MDEPTGRKIALTALIFPGQGSPLDDGAEIVSHFAPELGELAAALTGAEPFSVAADLDPLRPAGHLLPQRGPLDRRRASRGRLLRRTFAR